ncbi:mitochondrial fission ELM1 family protein [Hyphococcus sp.]|uniref:mitochondrial fission ELM1 family protein n=1 Tax=Hyphococcus sp. TaxID=2038636 RepID=UPI003CCB9CDC
MADSDPACSSGDGPIDLSDLWVLTDGKIGDDVQCIAVARAISGNYEKRIVTPRAPWRFLAPWGPVDPREAPGARNGPLQGRPPAIVVASGRRAIPHALALKRASDQHTKIVIMKDPRFGRSAADVLWAPAHDRLTGPNVISTLTSPHGLSENIAASRTAPASAIAGLPKPFLGVVLGGPSGGARYDVQAANELAKRISAAGANFSSIAITPSRRTPAGFMQAMGEMVKHQHVFLWNGEGNNPYIDILGNAESLVVAGDSHNMVSEAMASSAGVYVWRPAGLARKLSWFVDQLERKGHTRPFSDQAPSFEREPMDATPEIAAEIRRRLLR